MPRFHFYRVTMKDESGPQEGERWLYKCRVKADTDEDARRQVIGWLAAQNEPPAPPAGITPQELAHIRAHWNALRILTIEPGETEDLAAKWNVDLHSLIYWWDHVVLPAPEES